MIQTYRKEEIVHTEIVPAKIFYQVLEGSECFVPLHWHKDIEINVFLKNPARFIVDGIQKDYEVGDFIIINSEELHAGTGDPDTPESERKQELLTIQVDYDFLVQYFRKNGPLRLKEGAPEAYGKLRQKLLEMAELSLEHPYCYEMKVTALLLEVVSILLEFCTDDLPDQKSGIRRKTFSQIQRAVDYIEAYYYEDLSLSEVAGKMGWADSYFSRKFKMMTGSNYYEYLSRVRLKHAYYDLMATDTDITRIALDNGFPNVKSFITAFKKAYAMTPLKYRNEKKHQH